jgi:hypothetical protein
VVDASPPAFVDEPTPGTLLLDIAFRASSSRMALHHY